MVDELINRAEKSLSAHNSRAIIRVRGVYVNNAASIDRPSLYGSSGPRDKRVPLRQPEVTTATMTTTSTHVYSEGVGGVWNG
jgi:hypothetical protein